MSSTFRVACEMELKLGGGVGGMVWWPPNFGEAETLVDGGQRRTASRKPFLGGLWLIFCSNNTDDESTSTSSGIYVQRLHNVAKQNILFIFMTTNQFCCSRKIHTTLGSLLTADA